MAARWSGFDTCLPNSGRNASLNDMECVWSERHVAWLAHGQLRIGTFSPVMEDSRVRVGATGCSVGGDQTSCSRRIFPGLVVVGSNTGEARSGQTGDSWLFEIRRGTGMDWNPHVQSLLERGWRAENLP